MSSKAFKITRIVKSPGVIKFKESNNFSFNYSHSCLPEVLETLHQKWEYFPWDNGGMGVPIVIHKCSVPLYEDIAKKLGYREDEIKELFQTIVKDMGNEEYVIYFLV